MPEIYMALGMVNFYYGRVVPFYLDYIYPLMRPINWGKLQWVGIFIHNNFSFDTIYIILKFILKFIFDIITHIL
jgi:hypothetical protein